MNRDDFLNDDEYFNDGLNSSSEYYTFEKLSLTHSNNWLEILIIDDRPEDINLFTDLIKANIDIQHHITKCIKASEAIKMLQSPGNTYQPDFIILDITMPEMNGKQTLEKLKKETIARDIPVIIYSSMNTNENIRNVMKNSAAAFFKKPLNVGGFAEYISN